MNSAQHQRKHAGRGKDFIVLPLVFVLLTAAAVYLALSPVVKPYLGLARVFFSQNSQNAPTDRFTGLSEGLATSGEVTVDEKPVTGDLIGQIDIEEAGISVPLYYGDNSAQLNQGAGLYPGAWLPGQERTVLAAGHTGTFFRGLGDVQPGMEIRVTTYYGEYVYEVTETAVHEATDDTSYDFSRTDENLILYTCYPFDSLGYTPFRFFVYADYVSGPALTIAQQGGTS